MKNLVLIGMMGCGKTTCGRALSEQLHMPLVDTDALIVAQEGKTIAEIFAQRGEEAFRQLETAVAKQLGAQSGQIIATGGGLPLRQENVDALRENGLIVWLKRDPASTFASESMDGRPLAQDGQEAFIVRFQQRAPLYEKASHVIVEDFSSVEQTLAAIRSAWEQEKEGI